MKQSRFWLLALLSVIALVATSTPAIAEDESSSHFSGNVELGATYTDTKDNPARVNEYAKYRSKDGVSFAPSLNLESLSKGYLLGIEAKVRGPHDQNYSLETDFKRVFQLDVDYQVFKHWLEHETLENIGATMAGDVGGQQPRVSTDLTGGKFNEPLDVAQARYYQELDNNYIITHREWEGESSLTIPTLPNVTFHAGTRYESRKGLQQATTLSKCGVCHVQSNGKDIDEQTQDFTMGATGKFGLLTVDYEYLKREFEANGASPDYAYATSSFNRNGVTDDSQLLYSGLQDYNDTPDSDKHSHTVKARLDLPHSSMVSATYVDAKINSEKTDQPGVYTLDEGTLSSDLKSFFLKGATRIGGLRLTMTGGTYDLDGPDYYVYYPDRDDQPVENQDFPNPQRYESAESRDVTEVGIDGVYRLTRGTILRLGYEYEDVDRDDSEFGHTKTHTYNAAVKSRLNKQLSGRISYQYQDIDDPFHGEDITGIAQGGIDGLNWGTNGAGLYWLETSQFSNVSPNPNNGTVYYWNSVYPNRTLDATNQPDQIHEGKFSSTWTPSSSIAMTVFFRGSHETNDDVDYKQDTYVPGASFYYTPSNNLILTMAYTFNKMKTENQMCVGWYHG